MKYLYLSKELILYMCVKLILKKKISQNILKSLHKLSLREILKRNKDLYVKIKISFKIKINAKNEEVIYD